jgi:hypothetical protein
VASVVEAKVEVEAREEDKQQVMETNHQIKNQKKCQSTTSKRENHDQGIRKRL